MTCPRCSSHLIEPPDAYGDRYCVMCGHCIVTESRERRDARVIARARAAFDAPSATRKGRPSHMTMIEELLSERRTVTTSEVAEYIGVTFSVAERALWKMYPNRVAMVAKGGRTAWQMAERKEQGA